MSSIISIFLFFFLFSFASTIFLNVFSCRILSYFLIIFLAAFLLDLFGFSIETGTFTSPWSVLTFSILTILPGNLNLFFLPFAPLSTLYFSLIFFAAICAFLPGSRIAISSNIFIVSAVSSSTFGHHSFKSKYGFLFLFLLTFEVRFSFYRSVESISVLKKCPASEGILHAVSFFGETDI